MFGVSLLGEQGRISFLSVVGFSLLGGLDVF